MKSIPLTAITFNSKLQASALRKLRGAVIESVMQHKAVFEAASVSTDWFHNHEEQTMQPGVDAAQRQVATTHHRYPLIQYKIRQHKAELVGIGDGAQALQLWLSMIGNELMVNREVISIDVYHHNHINWKPKLLATCETYRINQWLPLNPKNYEVWEKTPRLVDRVQLLDKALWGQLFNLTDNLRIELDRRKLELYINTIDLQTFKNCFGSKRLALDVTFSTNLNLPDDIGLGKGVSIGFGKVQKIKVKPEEIKKTVREQKSGVKEE